MRLRRWAHASVPSQEPEGREEGTPERNRHVQSGHAVFFGTLARGHGAEKIVPDAQDLSVVAVMPGTIGRVVNRVENGAHEKRVELSVAPVEIGMLHRLENILHEHCRSP